MPIPLTKNLMHQLPGALKGHEGEWCKLTCEINNGEYIITHGVLEITNTSVQLREKDDFITEITYDQISDSPVIIINVGRYDENKNKLVNLELISMVSGLKTDNKWSPPNEVQFPHKRNVDFEIMSELQVSEIIQKFQENLGTTVTIFLKYFDEDTDTLNDYLNNNKVGQPNTKDIVINGEVINGSILNTDQNEELTIFYNQSLGSGMIFGLRFKSELAFANLAYEINK